ncbi:MAG: UxaA family hydrolase, partial [Lachnospiraceae bacterium]|nr:UxaA family hydrolase [Lachnospiraceae bacterium]
MQKFLKINEQDNCVVALQPLQAGEVLEVSGMQVTVAQDIPAGHKVALGPITRGQQVIKYGYPIGNATEDIGAGQWIHTHNIKTGLGELLEYCYEPITEQISAMQGATEGQEVACSEAADNRKS